MNSMTELKNKLKKLIDARYIEGKKYVIRASTNFRSLVYIESDIRWKLNYNGCRNAYYDRLDHYEELAMRDPSEIAYAEPVSSQYDEDFDDYNYG